MKVLSFGEILWDVIEDVKYLGGAPLNFAAHFKQCGGQSAILSRIGMDEDGEYALKAIKELGVDISLVQKDQSYPTGLVNVTLNNSQPSYVIQKKVAYDFIEEPSVDLSAFDCLYFGTLSQRNDTSKNTLKKLLEMHQFSEVFYDVNLRKDSYNATIISESILHCTILKLNDDEVNLISQLLIGKDLSFNDFAHYLFSKSDVLKMIIVTMGAKGCSIFYRSGETHHVEAERVIVEDTVGAGDSFSASFLYFHKTGMDGIKAAQLANTIAGFVASNKGPTPSYDERIRKLVND